MLSNPQQRALQALITQPTKKEAAAAAGIAIRTLETYLHNEEFISEYGKACRQLVTNATRQTQQALNPAITALVDIVSNEEEAAPARISAARALLEYGLRLTEFSDILSTLEEIGG